jgi:hypothetical protein
MIILPRVPIVRSGRCTVVLVGVILMGRVVLSLRRLVKPYRGNDRPVVVMYHRRCSPVMHGWRNLDALTEHGRARIVGVVVLRGVAWGREARVDQDHEGLMVMVVMHLTGLAGHVDEDPETEDGRFGW